jgi:nucleotide-binding universal stress UspA family protein
MKKLLVAYDGSDNAMRAVRYAAEAAQENRSLQLELLHVLDPVTFKVPAASLSPDDLTRLYPDKADRVLQPARRILDDAGIAYRVRCRVGAVAPEIAAQVRESGCAGVIMGTRGLSPIATIMIGSVANRVVQIVDVPVTLVK